MDIHNSIYGYPQSDLRISIIRLWISLSCFGANFSDHDSSAVFLSVPGIHGDRISSLTSKKSSSLCLAAAMSVTSLARPSTCSLAAIFDTCPGCRSSVIVTSYLLASKLASDTCIYGYP